jgi:hypothetical protein
MLVHLLGSATGPERAFLGGYLARPAAHRSDADVATVLDLMHAHSSIEVANAWADTLASAARAAFLPAFAPAASRFHARFVEELIAFVVTRAH